MGATCSFITVQSGDSCGALASRCGISPNDFTSYNPDPNLCSSLVPGQRVCCSAGSLPDQSPQPNPDGSCYVYTVQSGDYCDLIAANQHTSSSAIEQNNKQTWGWSGCGGLNPGDQICLSSGTPPMPKSNANAVCGPTVPGTQKPSNWNDLGSLNPCPLNACCSQFGSCGTTEDYCNAVPSSTGAPGTSGCISNCGKDIVNNGNAPSQFIRVGYFAGYNKERSCLNMNADQIPSGYTHVHFSFGDITSNFDIDMSAYKTQFDLFRKQTQFKRIVSFGGWSFSNNPGTNSIFSDGMKSENRQKFANNVVAAIQKFDIDGVDFDWESVGATNADDGANYLAFLQLLHSILPAGKTVSIAVPPSYGTLKAFPITEMSKVVDYIVYMTYDYHSQLDYGVVGSQSGCLFGICLRSHVNLTETVNSLAMITKAGVPSTKVVVGIANYGRSFGMTYKDCTGPSCWFTGPQSGAALGRCTQEAGYLAQAEIEEKIGTSGVNSWHDDASNSDIVTFPDGTWVAYLNENTKAFRRFAYQYQNWAGTVEWAVDQISFATDS